MTVYITQEMRGKDISDAANFGDLKVLLPADRQVTFSTQPTVRRLMKELANFNDDDYLLLAGDPAGIAIACTVAAKFNKGRYKVLKWDRLEERYYPLQIDTNFNPGASDD